MERPKRVTKNYSLKNIPLPTATMYKKRLIEMTESVLKRMRWRAHFFLTRGEKPNKEDNKPEDYNGLNSRKCPPQVREMEAFETDVAKLIEGIEFRKVRNRFQDSLTADTKQIKESPGIFIRADKTSNLYEVSTTLHEKLLRENITRHYKPASNSAHDDINAEAQAIADTINPELTRRMDIMAKSQAFLTLKDHKENFNNSLPCRLINPAKSEMGLASKKIIDSINNCLKVKLGLNIWKNSSSVTKWFNSIQQKDQCTFISFDIVEFYPSISEELLSLALSFARSHIDISAEEMEIIHHARKSLLFDNGKPWMKKGNAGLFDVTMGSFDGAEVCQLVGTFALTKLSEQYKKEDMGLYRDDGLAVIRGASGPQTERIKKSIVSKFKELGLKVAIQSNLKTCNFLDLTLCLNNGRHYPFRKDNDTPLYINRSSNHPPAIIKNLPAAISRRLTDISSDKEAFEEAAPMYNDALKESGYSEQVEFMEARKNETLTQKRRRNRTVTWFNPPFSLNVRTNVAKKFLGLVDKHFPPDCALHKIFNRATIKVSYSCMPNMHAVIRQHNTAVRRKQDTTQTSNTITKQCNCRSPQQCPLSGKCLTENIVYKATVTTNEPKTCKEYIGSTATTFKQRFSNHMSSTRLPKYEKSTALSQHIWELKREGKDHKVSWEICAKARPYTPETKRCNLCITEKLWISNSTGNLLNHRSELVSTCRHQNRFQLAHFKRGGVT